jgi:hypothetical protein
MSSGGYSIYRKQKGDNSVYRKQKEPAGKGTTNVSPLCVKNMYIHAQTDPELLDTSVPFTNTLFVENKFSKPTNTFNSRVFSNSEKCPSYREMLVHTPLNKNTLNYQKKSLDEYSKINSTL